MRPVLALPLLAISLSMLAATAIPEVHAQDASRNYYRQAKVANFSIPGTDYATPEFESFALWSDGKQTRVTYYWGGKETPLRSLGPNPDGTSFGVSFPNGLVLDITPTDKGLRVRDRKGGYDKRFAWMYEGPVEGRGTYCDQCVDEQDAVAFVRQHYLRR